MLAPGKILASGASAAKQALGTSDENMGVAAQGSKPLELPSANNVMGEVQKGLSNGKS